MVTTNSTNTYIVAPTTWEVTMPNQPAFHANTVGEVQDNVTGDGTIQTVIFSNELVDQGGDFDGTSTFTAPATGNYLFSFSVCAANISAAMVTGNIRIKVSGANSYFLISPGVAKDASNYYTFVASKIYRMTAASTSIIYLQLSNGTKVVDVLACSTCYFSGKLLC